MRCGGTLLAPPRASRRGPASFGYRRADLGLRVRTPTLLHQVHDGLVTRPSDVLAIFDAIPSGTTYGKSCSGSTAPSVAGTGTCTSGASRTGSWTGSPGTRAEQYRSAARPRRSRRHLCPAAHRKLGKAGRPAGTRALRHDSSPRSPSIHRRLPIGSRSRDRAVPLAHKVSRHPISPQVARQGIGLWVRTASSATKARLDVRCPPTEARRNTPRAPAPHRGFAAGDAHDATIRHLVVAGILRAAARRATRRLLPGLDIGAASGPGAGRASIPGAVPPMWLQALPPRAVSPRRPFPDPDAR